MALPARRVKDTLTEDQVEELALHLASGLTQQEASRRLDISHVAVHLRLERPEFQALVAKKREERLSRIASKAEKMTEDSLDLLHALSKDETVDPKARVTAAKAIIDLFSRMHPVETRQGPPLEAGQTITQTRRIIEETKTIPSSALEEAWHVLQGKKRPTPAPRTSPEPSGTKTPPPPSSEESRPSSGAEGA